MVTINWIEGFNILKDMLLVLSELNIFWSLMHFSLAEKLADQTGVLKKVCSSTPIGYLTLMAS